MVPAEQGSVFLTSLKVEEGGEKGRERGALMLMEGFKRERVKVKGNEESAAKECEENTGRGNE